MQGLRLSVEGACVQVSFPGFRFQGLGVSVSVQCSGLKVLGLGVYGSEFCFQVLGLGRFCISWFCVQCSWFNTLGLGFIVQDSRDRFSETGSRCCALGVPVQCFGFNSYGELIWVQAFGFAVWFSYQDRGLLRV